MAALRFTFAIACYLLFFATFLYLVGFVGNLFLPRTVDAGPTVAPVVAAIFDVVLMLIFGLQHSVMARPAFKRRITRIVHPSMERSVYVLASVLALWLLFALWQPIPGEIWTTYGTGAAILWIGFAAGWTIVFISTWLLDHFELFGLRQAWFDLRVRSDQPQQFREPLFYRVVRHPLYLGFLLAFWSIPTMTWGHLLFAAVMTGYIIMAIRYEERDLMDALGERYVDYRKRVGMLLPGIGKAR